MTVPQGAAGSPTTARRNLKLVKPAVVDIYASWRAEIAARDWSACHVAGDRNPSLELSDRPKRNWRA
jgi:hypothetical protein